MEFTKEELTIATDEMIRKVQEKKVSKNADNLFKEGIKRTISNNLYFDDDRLFLKTGDIPAMWLRDSTFQVIPFVEFADNGNIFEQFVREILRSQFEYIQIDPYANSFNIKANNHHFAIDESNVEINPYVWERKFELDSLCSPIFLSKKLYDKTKNTAIFDKLFWDTVRIILDTFTTEQRHAESEYFFKRMTESISDTLPNDGKGNPINYTGMIWSGFRPSDDPCEYGYLIPSNMFAVSILQFLEEIILNGIGPQECLKDVQKLISEINQGIEKFGKIKKHGNEIYAYEVDGLGNSLLIDDANMPNLLSASLLGFEPKSKDTYKRTVEFILSDENPYFFKSKQFKGLGSSHTPKNYIWPIALATEGLMKSNKQKKLFYIEKIIELTGNSYCHESVNVNDTSLYTRESFSWADMMYSWLYLDYLKS